MTLQATASRQVVKALVERTGAGGGGLQHADAHQQMMSLHGCDGGGGGGVITIRVLSYSVA
jgi:hypothetical protein